MEDIMAAIQIRNISIGTGKPKICIPLTQTNIISLEEECRKLLQVPCDLAEWRADFFDDLLIPGRLEEVLQMLRRTLGEIPLLFTIRTRSEGGNTDMAPDDYLACCRAAADTGLIDLADAELSMGDDIFSRLIRAAHRQGVYVIGSRHDFRKTPSREDLLSSLDKMHLLGADIGKYAVMPHTKRDVLTLMEASLAMNERFPDFPVITMSMGRLGVLSRMGGAISGSCVTFGTAGHASAPGQIPAEELANILNILDNTAT